MHENFSASCDSFFDEFDRVFKLRLNFLLIRVQQIQHAVFEVLYLVMVSISDRSRGLQAKN